MINHQQSIDYDHAQNLHSLNGAQTAMPLLFAGVKPLSFLDVGCGVGTWLRAASNFGISDFMGVDGVDIPASQLLIPADKIKRQDLTRPWALDRRFDAAICLEVAEHLESTFAPVLIEALAKHSDLVFFSAACPGQDGQHHVNCQWPDYWQKLFNDIGYVCSDDIRWRIWGNKDIEPWYRQNIFCARRAASLAGQEPRISSVIHPEMIEYVFERERLQTHIQQIENGLMKPAWYAKTLVSALLSKIARRV